MSSHQNAPQKSFKGFPGLSYIYSFQVYTLMTRPKRHHFVPKWYLEKFVDPQSGCLHAYDKTRKYYFTPKPNQTMVKKDYNKQDTPKGIDQDILEKSLGEWLEPKAKRCFETLLTRPQDLTEADSAIMMAYLEHQRLCVPRQAETAKYSIREVLLHLALQAPPDIIPSEAKTALMTGGVGIEIKDHFRFHFMKMASGFLIPYFARMEWEIVETEEGSSFITSDNPVSFVNIGSPPPLEPGIALVGTRVFFPLDSQHMLILWHPEYQANAALPPSEPIPDPVLADGRIHVIYEKQFPKELVNLTNSIILNHAEKLIVGSSKEILENAAARA